MSDSRYDVAVVGGGVAGMSTAARLESRGFSTVVIEQHDRIGGCAGYFRRQGFAFDVGATTLVDFHPDGVGGRLLEEVGFEPPPIDIQRAYTIRLPDRTVTLYRDPEAWAAERRAKLGDDDRHLEFYAFVDDLSRTLWRVTRTDVKMPIQRVGDVVGNARAVGIRGLPVVRYLRWTVADALRAHGVYDDHPLRTTVGMLVQDTVHSTVEEAPLLNSILGMTIRRPGIGRARGGMYGFWRSFAEQYRAAGGTIETGERVTEVTGEKGAFRVRTDADEYRADQVVSTVPVDLTRRIAPSVVGDRLDEYVATLRRHEGGAVMVFLGVPEGEVDGHAITHHQVLTAYDEPLGDGNNMFVSVSAPDDRVSAPEGHRAVMISTHCDLDPWLDLGEEAYERRAAAAGERLVSRARTVYPDLGADPVVYDVATPATYEAFTNRPRGAIGGYRQTLDNANQRAVPQDVGVDGFYLAGDTTWPGLGTVACVKGSAIAADHVSDAAAGRSPFK